MQKRVLVDTFKLKLSKYLFKSKPNIELPKKFAKIVQIRTSQCDFPKNFQPECSSAFFSFVSYEQEIKSNFWCDKYN